VSTIDAATVAENVAAVRERITAAGGRADVEIVAVTKTFGPEAISAALAAGCRSIGENYAQELLAKLDELPASAPRPTVRFIGHLQSNKVRQLAHVVDVWETLDRASVIDEVARRSPGARVLVQVNVSAEPQKGGCDPGLTPELVGRARQAGLIVEGLMTVGAPGPVDVVRPGFRMLRRLADELDLAVCSMGMSADLEVAVEEGATEVRIGSALFGPRVRHLRTTLG
jgi:PLP dependent protein